MKNVKKIEDFKSFLRLLITRKTQKNKVLTEEKISEKINKLDKLENLSTFSFLGFSGLFSCNECIFQMFDKTSFDSLETSIPAWFCIFFAFCSVSSLIASNWKSQTLKEKLKSMQNSK